MKIRATKLHQPIEVEANITGKSWTWEIYTVAKEQAIPNLARMIAPRNALVA